MDNMPKHSNLSTIMFVFQLTNHKKQKHGNQLSPSTTYRNMSSGWGLGDRTVNKKMRFKSGII